MHDNSVNCRSQTRWSLTINCYAFAGKGVCHCDVWTHDLQNSQSAFDDIWSRCDRDLLTSESNQFIFVHNCTQVVVKLSQAVCTISCPWTFSIRLQTHRYTDSPQTECRQQLIASEAITKLKFVDQSFRTYTHTCMQSFLRSTHSGQNCA